jgi:probable rRNA maturation factor
MVILLKNLENGSLINDRKLKRRLGIILKALGKSDYTISILITTDEEIKTYNRDFRKVDKPTNVLAFPSTDPGLEEEEDIPPTPTLKGPYKNYLGDIAISFETILREAKALEMDEGELMYFYFIHGILHLIGYDHELGEEEEKAQDEETYRLMKLIPHSLL